MKKLAFLFSLLVMLGLGVSCSENEGELNDVQREEAPLENAGESMEEGVQEMEDEGEQLGEEVEEIGE